MARRRSTPLWLRLVCAVWTAPTALVSCSSGARLSMGGYVAVPTPRFGQRPRGSAWLPPARPRSCRLRSHARRGQSNQSRPGSQNNTLARIGAARALASVEIVLGRTSPYEQCPSLAGNVFRRRRDDEVRCSRSSVSRRAVPCPSRARRVEALAGRFASSPVAPRLPPASNYLESGRKENTRMSHRPSAVRNAPSRAIMLSCTRLWKGSAAEYGPYVTCTGPRRRRPGGPPSVPAR